MGHGSSPATVEVLVPEGASGFEVALGIVAILTKSHGAVVTEVGYGQAGPIVTLKVPLCRPQPTQG